MGFILIAYFTLAIIAHVHVFAALSKVMFQFNGNQRIHDEHIVGDNKLTEDERIVGGYKAETGEFPYQISMRYNGNQHFCGGSILNENYILTAAHCVMRFNASDITVFTGTNTLSTGGDSYSVKRLIPHAKYNQSTLVNDVALMELENSITFNDQVKTVKISAENINADTTLTLSGWGRTSKDGEIPENLQAINLLSISNDKCDKEIKSDYIIAETHLCTFTMAGEGVCSGDSGGPLVYNGEQVGIVSWAFPCAKGKPDVFTRVLNYKDWIAEIMKINAKFLFN